MSSEIRDGKLSKRLLIRILESLLSQEKKIDFVFNKISMFVKSQEKNQQLIYKWIIHRWYIERKTIYCFDHFLVSETRDLQKLNQLGPITLEINTKI